MDRFGRFEMIPRGITLLHIDHDINRSKSPIHKHEAMMTRIEMVFQIVLMSRSAHQPPLLIVVAYGHQPLPPSSSSFLLDSNQKIYNSPPRDILSPLIVSPSAAKQPPSSHGWIYSYHQRNGRRGGFLSSQKCLKWSTLFWIYCKICLEPTQKCVQEEERRLQGINGFWARQTWVRTWKSPN